MKWISLRSSEPLLRVRILPGAQNTKTQSYRFGFYRILYLPEGFDYRLTNMVVKTPYFSKLRIRKIYKLKFIIFLKRAKYVLESETKQNHERNG